MLFEQIQKASVKLLINFFNRFSFIGPQGHGGAVGVGVRNHDDIVSQQAVVAGNDIAGEV